MSKKHILKRISTRDLTRTQAAQALAARPLGRDRPCVTATARRLPVARTLATDWHRQATVLVNLNSPARLPGSHPSAKVPCAYFAYLHILRGMICINCIYLTYILHIFCIFFAYSEYWYCCILLRLATYFLHIFCVFCIFLLMPEIDFCNPLCSVHQAQQDLFATCAPGGGGGGSFARLGRVAVARASAPAAAPPPAATAAACAGGNGGSLLRTKFEV